MTTTYEVHQLTGSTLIDATGRSYANESAGVLSRHRTWHAAERAALRFRRIAPCGLRVEIREVTR